MTKNEIKCPEGCRLLGKEEKVAAGDLYSCLNGGGWNSVGVNSLVVGQFVKHQADVYARKLSLINKAAEEDELEYPEGYRRLQPEEPIAFGDMYFDGHEWGSVGRTSAVVGALAGSLIVARKCESTVQKKEPVKVTIPDGYRLLNQTDFIAAGDLYCSDRVPNPPWYLIEAQPKFTGKSVQGLSNVFARKIEAASQEKEPLIKVPKGYRRLNCSDIVEAGMYQICFEEFDDNEFADIENYEIVHDSEDPLDTHVGCFAGDFLSLIFVEKIVSKEKEEKKEKKMGISDGFFAMFKASAVTAAKQGASTLLADKITELVIARLPASVQRLAAFVPNEILSLVISSAVYAAASKFDIPGRERVKDVSKYAVDGTMFQSVMILTKFLEPIFTAIKNFAPSDLKELMDEASEKTK